MKALRVIAADAWAFRTAVENDAALRFDRLATSLASFDESSPIIAMLRQAAEDERRHFNACATLATQFGGELPSMWPTAAPSVSPANFELRHAVLYEMTAACCVTETESMATLTSLLTKAGPEVASVVRSIARDEVRHAQMGWAHLERERSMTDVGFLSTALPHMFEGAAGSRLFDPDIEPALEDEGLWAYGVLPMSVKRIVFVSAIEEVMLPGFRRVGIDDGPSLAWLTRKKNSFKPTALS